MISQLTSTGLMERFPALDLPGFAHGLVKRIPEVPLSYDKSATLALLQPWHDQAVRELGFGNHGLYTAEQIHGTGICEVTPASPRWSPGVDGLITGEPGILLGIHTADCAPVFIIDPVRKAVALLHSGRKSTEGGITPLAIIRMKAAFGSNPADLLIQIGPCIRPPLFETDLPVRIRGDALAAGVQEGRIFDCGTCTGKAVEQYYSYRVEKGRTGRMLSLLGLRG